LEVPEEPQDKGPQDKEPQETQHGQGRPKGQRNRRRTENNKLRRSERHLITKHDDQFIAAIEEDNVSITFITHKEQADIELVIKLRKMALSLLQEAYLKELNNRKLMVLSQEESLSLYSTTLISI
jgi:hypothetical protein